MFHNKSVWVLGILILGGCQYPVRQQVDNLVCRQEILDVAPAPKTKVMSESSPAPGGTPVSNRDDREIDGSSALVLASAQDVGQESSPLVNGLLKKVDTKSGVPGSTAESIKMPQPGKDKDGRLKYAEAAKDAAKLHFKDLPPLAPEFAPARGPNGQPLTLSDLQKLARANSPQLRQAAANIEAFKGAAVQSGLYPNPTFSLSGVTTGPSGGPNIGPSLTQTIKTMNKLGLSQAAAVEDLKMAELAYRRAQTDLAWNVRSGYFAVLVAQESIRANRALVTLTDDVYHVMVKQFANGESPMYEPMQLGVFAYQARASLIQARNAYTVAWKTLSSTLGLPGMPPTEVAGRIHELKMPVYKHADVLGHVLKFHTDALTADENIKKARYNLRLAQVTPIPDLNAQIGGWYDNNQGSGPFRTVAMFNVGCVIPVWDQNKGAIRQQQGMLVQMMEEPHRVRTVLTANLADAFRRYDENRDLLRMYRESILPKQVQAFRSALKRYDVVTGELGYWDIINSEQNLVTMIGNYLPILGSYWQAVADVANLLQTDDIFQMSTAIEPVSMLDLEEMIKCCHPCGNMHEPGARAFDPNWHLGGTDIMAPSPAPKKLPAGMKQSMPLLPMSPVRLNELPPETVRIIGPETAPAAQIDFAPLLETPFPVTEPAAEVPQQESRVLVPGWRPADRSNTPH